MGIENLLQFLKPLMEQTNLDKFSGSTLAIDGMSWLYRACYCSFNLSSKLLEKDFSQLYLQELSPWSFQYFARHLQLLSFYNIRVIVVFDGRSLSSKKDTIKERKQTREHYFEFAKTQASEGNMEQANKFLKRCVVVGKQQVEQMIDFVRQLNYEFVVAPYEADAQIAFMCKNQIVDFAVTEDSDLVPFGCNKVIYKLESTGACQYLDLDKFKSDRKNRENLNDRLRTWLTLDENNMIYSCIMAGCDYLPSIKGFLQKLLQVLIKEWELKQQLNCQNGFLKQIS